MNLYHYIIRKIFYSKYGNDIMKNISYFDLYVKINNIQHSDINIDTYVDIFNYHSDNNTIMTPYYEDMRCLDNYIINMECFKKINLIKNNKYNYIWLKLEKKDKKSFTENIDIYMVDINNIFEGFYFDKNKLPYIDILNNFVVENSNEYVLYNNINIIDGNYSMYNLYLNISNNIHLKKKIYTIYFGLKIR